MAKESKKTEEQEELGKKPKTSKKEEEKKLMTKAEMAKVRRTLLRFPEEGELNI
jgi:hypothetical protein